MKGLLMNWIFALSGCLAMDDAAPYQRDAGLGPASLFFHSIGGYRIKRAYGILYNKWECSQRIREIVHYAS